MRNEQQHCCCMDDCFFAMRTGMMGMMGGMGMDESYGNDGSGWE